MMVKIQAKLFNRHTVGVEPVRWSYTRLDYQYYRASASVNGRSALKRVQFITEYWLTDWRLQLSSHTRTYAADTSDTPRTTRCRRRRQLSTRRPDSVRQRAARPSPAACPSVRIELHDDQILHSTVRTAMSKQTTHITSQHALTRYFWLKLTTND